MRLGGQRLDPLLYFQALPVYARNLGVILAPLAAAAIGVGLDYLAGALFAAVGGAGGGIFSLITRLIEGYAFAVAVIFADDAWRHGRGNLGAAWGQARRRAGDIIITVLGFLFLTYVASLVGSFLGIIGSYVLTALAVWAFLYAIPATAIGGHQAGTAFSASLQAARRNPLATALIAIVSVVVWLGLTQYALGALTPYLSLPAYYAAMVLLTAIAIGYIALIVTKQYTDFAFTPYW
jgi:hypothetical protein